MSCKGICIRHKAASNNYANGQKRCHICEMFIKWDDLSCPCCRHKIRTRPRNHKLYEKLRKKALHELKNTKISSHYTVLSM